MKIKHPLFFLTLCLLSTVVIAQKPVAKPAQKNTTTKPKAKVADNGGLVASLAELYLGAGENKYAGNAKVLRGAMRPGDKFEIITRDDKRVGCTIKTIQLQSNRLKIERAGKDAELLIVFTVDKSDVECDFGCICTMSTLKNYAEFEQVKKAYKASPNSGKGSIGNSQLFSLDKE